MQNLQTAGAGGTPYPRLDPTASAEQFPYGKAKNDDPPGSKNGTPFTIEIGHDPLQSMYAILTRAGRTPNGEIENVQNSDLLKSLEDLFFVVCDLKFHYGITAPSDSWLVCDGSTFDDVKYANLVALIGTNVTPNYKGRVIVGYDPADPYFNEIGELGGVLAHALEESEMPSHFHEQRVESSTTGGSNDPPKREPNGDNIINSGVSTGSKGGGLPHINLQPYGVMQVLIKGK